MAELTEFDEQSLSPGVPLAPQAPVRSITPPAPSQAAPMVMARPPGVQRTVAAPTPANQALQQQVEMAQMGDIGQAEQNVTAAIRFQGMRGFQKDIQNGMPNAEAFAKWAPTMFMQPKGTPGQAASLINATRPRIQQAGGVIYGVNAPTAAAPAGSLTRLPGQDPRTAQQKVGTLDAQTHKSYLDELRKVENDLDAAPGGPAADELRTKATYLRSQLKAIEDRYQPKTVTRRTKSGRRAIFDADTKRFLRYAD